MSARLLYVADPMCSWCWGFSGVLAELEAHLPESVSTELVLGGLAPDSDAPMDAATRDYVRDAWRAVEARTGARFNHDFWERCQPRRSTWPACRAVLAAAERGREMFAAIQRAYYLDARDPSDKATLIELGTELGFDASSFAEELDADRTRARLNEHFRLRDQLGVRGYPSLALADDAGTRVLSRGWVPAEQLQEPLAHLLER